MSFACVKMFNVLTVNVVVQMVKAYVIIVWLSAGLDSGVTVKLGFWIVYVPRITVYSRVTSSIGD